jgi:hypothetical protein
MPQIDDLEVLSDPAIIRSAAFRAGVEDVRAGRPARFDDFTVNVFLYEWGRQFGFLVPMSFPLIRNGRPTHEARQLLRRAFARGELIDSPRGTYDVEEKESGRCPRRP